MAAFQVSPAGPDERNLVRKRGLEPLCPTGASTSSWCVCQFRHLRTVVNTMSITKAGILRNGNFNYGDNALETLSETWPRSKSKCNTSRRDNVAWKSRMLSCL